MTQSYLIVDTAVILAAGFVFGWKHALYAIIALYVSGIVAETTLEGGSTARTAMIVTAQPKEIAARILDELERGVTLLDGTGRVHRRESSRVVCCDYARGSCDFKGNCA